MQAFVEDLSIQTESQLLLEFDSINSNLIVRSDSN